MTRILIILMLFIFGSAYGQIDNRWQPDSLYRYLNVKKILVYLNSPKDLSEILEFDSEGCKIRSTKYSASYNRRTRNYKRINRISTYLYDSEKRPIQIIDSIIHISNNVSINNTYYEYDTTWNLKASRFYRSTSDKPYLETHYDSSKTIHIRLNDSMIVSHFTSEYEKGFYLKSSYGYSLEPTLKTGVSIIDGDTSTYQYSDYGDLQRFEQTETINSEFDLNGRILNSDVNVVFLNDRKQNYTLHYKYYKNGLFKSIRGYVPRFFEYEFHE